MAVDLRRSVRELRSLIVTITPPGLRRQPLLASLKDLVAPLEDRGLDVDVAVTADEQELDAADRRPRAADRAGGSAQHPASRRRPPCRRAAALADDERVVLTVSDDGDGLRRRGRAPGGATAWAWTCSPAWPRSRAAGSRCARPPGDGTQLELVVPRRVPRAGAGVIRVLLVDDHPVVRRGLTDLHVRGRGHGRRRRPWRTAAEAAAAVREHRPDVVLMDLSMPRMHGTAGHARGARRRAGDPRRGAHLVRRGRLR